MASRSSIRVRRRSNSAMSIGAPPYCAGVIAERVTQETRESKGRVPSLLYERLHTSGFSLHPPTVASLRSLSSLGCSLPLPPHHVEHLLHAFGARSKPCHHSSLHPWDQNHTQKRAAAAPLGTTVLACLSALTRRGHYCPVG